VHLQRGQLGQIGEGEVGENGDLVVAEIAVDGMPSGELAKALGGSISRDTYSRVRERRCRMRS